MDLIERHRSRHDFMPTDVTLRYLIVSCQKSEELCFKIAAVNLIIAKRFDYLIMH